MITNEKLVDALEGLAFGIVGMTARALNETGHERELTLTQWRVLVVLGNAPLRVGAIAERIGVSLASASRLVTRMEDRGFVRAAQDQQDRRATLVSLAPLGVAIRDQAILRRRRLLEDLVADDPVLAGSNLQQGLGIIAERLSRLG
jgi:DNA-binding MarR family transcriptional regulator